MRCDSFSGETATRARGRPHRFRRACAGAGRALRSGEGVGALPRARGDELSPEAGAGRRARLRGGRATISTPAIAPLRATTATASCRAAHRPCLIATGSGGCPSRSMPTPWRRPRPLSWAATTSRPFARPNARRTRRCRTLDRLDVKRRGEEIIVEASARSFLHNQVRSMVGSLKLVGEGKWTRARSQVCACSVRSRGVRAGRAGIGSLSGAGRLWHAQRCDRGDRSRRRLSQCSFPLPRTGGMGH